jgi:hypothetical protein
MGSFAWHISATGVFVIGVWEEHSVGNRLHRSGLIGSWPHSLSPFRNGAIRVLIRAGPQYWVGMNLDVILFVDRSQIEVRNDLL